MPGTTDGRVLRAQRLRRAKRAEILRAARHVFADKGYHDTSIQDLLEAASIARGTFYLHFDGKAACFAEILDDFVDQLEAVLEPVDVDAPESNDGQLLGNLDRAMSLLGEHADLSALLFGPAMGVSDEVRDHVRGFFDRIAALIKRSLVAGQGIGLVRPGDDDLRALFILGAVKEMAQLALDDPRRAGDRARLARALLDFVMGGLLPRGAARS